MPKSEKHYSLREFALRVEISEQVARRLLKRRKVAYTKIGGQLRIAESDLQSFLQRSRVAAISENN